MTSQRANLLWDTAVGFTGFFTLLALAQAILNLFRPAPALWPGLLAALLCGLMWGLWRARHAHLAALQHQS